jgi:hypothetical protein
MSDLFDQTIGWYYLIVSRTLVKHFLDGGSASAQFHKNGIG